MKEKFEHSIHTPENMLEFIQKADTLVEALPYIQQFHEKAIVIKYGGSFMYDKDIKESIMDDIALMKLVGLRPIIVHGGGKDISGMLNNLDIRTEFIDGHRVTNDETINVAEMVLSGKINKEIVQLLEDRGINAVGISGKDGATLKVKKKLINNLDIGFVGDIQEVNSDLIKILEEHNYVPVVAPIGFDENGQSYNINADHAAYAIAKALKAEKLVYLTDTDGVYYDPDDPETVIRQLNSEHVPELIEKGVISGGMIPKVENSVDAIKNGVHTVHILDGKILHSLLLEIFTEAGCGTMIYQPEHLKKSNYYIKNEFKKTL